MLEFESADLQRIGGKCGLRDRQWGEVRLGIKDNETDHTHVIEISVLVPRRPDATMSELEAVASSQATAILEAALILLKGSSLAELMSQEYAAEEAAEQAGREELQRQIDAIGKSLG